MKKKPTLLAYLFLLFISFMVLLGYVSMKLSIDEMKKKKVSMENEILVMKEDIVKLNAEYQFFSSEERIRALASNQLGMIFNPISIETIKLSKTEIDELTFKLENHEYQ